eukprot:TRINITY_DN21833_c0_g1_i1.p1 TRINITY_DN21833_c0_g1~~TRINITY_DN21833_c0_g1_i1.p1  ORF type:complete len:571 (-),score=42.93 TRINITY_DN21833_c0_g1_i1:699-2243(-)
MIDMKLALKKLTELSKLTMDQLITASINPEQFQDTSKQELVSINMENGQNVDVEMLTNQIISEDSVLRKCEEMMYSIYSLLDDMKSSLKLSRNEICLTVRSTRDGPRWLLFPGSKLFKCLCANPLPYEELEYVQANIRRVARHLWAVLLSIDNMWDETVHEVIKQRYPQEVLPQIRSLTSNVLDDIEKAFPGQYYVSTRSLAPLEMAVEAMFHISNRWRTRAAIKNNSLDDPLAQQGRQRALKRSVTRNSSLIPRTPLIVNQVLESHKHLMFAGRTRSLFDYAGIATPAQIALRARSLEILDLVAANSPLNRSPNQRRTPLQFPMAKVVEEHRDEQDISDFGGSWYEGKEHHTNKRNRKSCSWMEGKNSQKYQLINWNQDKNMDNKFENSPSWSNLEQNTNSARSGQNDFSNMTSYRSIQFSIPEKSEVGVDGVFGSKIEKQDDNEKEDSNQDDELRSPFFQSLSLIQGTPTKKSKNKRFKSTDLKQNGQYYTFHIWKSRFIWRSKGFHLKTLN